MKRLLFFIIILLSIYSTKAQFVLNIEDGPQFSDTEFLVTEAGEDFPDKIDSENIFYVSVYQDNMWDKWSNPNQKWRISVHREDVAWDKDIRLRIRRTGPGIKTQGGFYDNDDNDDDDDDDEEEEEGELSGPSMYVVVNTNPRYFFSGTGSVKMIPIATRLRKVSVAMGAGDYETNMVFTVTED